MDFCFWLLDQRLPTPTYTPDLPGLLNCYLAGWSWSRGGLPFSLMILLGNVVYSSLLFSAFALAQRYFTALREEKQQPAACARALA